VSAAGRERWAVGVDVGGTKTAFGLVASPSGRLAFRTEVATPERAASGAAFLDLVAETVRGLVARGAAAACHVEAVGLAVCELVDAEGAIASAHRVRWQGLPLPRHLAGLPPWRVEADVRAAALAEARWGAGRQFREFLYVSLGTGVSACWVRDGRPHAGARGNALVLASSPQRIADSAGDRPLVASPEELGGGAGLLARYNAEAAVPLGSTQAMLAAAEAGDPLARRVSERGALALGVNLGLAIDILDPEAVVIGGGLGAGSAYYRGLLVEATRPQIWAPATRTLPILAAALGGDAGVVGAAAAAWPAEG